MTVRHVDNPWVPFRRSPAEPLVRLICFPYAGAGATALASWHRELEPHVEVCAVEYPGRWTSDREPWRSIDDLVMQAQVGLAPLLTGSYAFFGYSFGAVVAFELARALVRRGMRAPSHLFVGARQAPHLPSAKPHIHRMSDADFLHAMEHRYGAIPAPIRNEPELLQKAVHMLRGYIGALETYEHRAEPALSCPITAFAGREDRTLGEGLLTAWSVHTGGAFASHMVEGGHFFAGSAERRVLRTIREALLVNLPARQNRDPLRDDEIRQVV